MSIDPFPPYNRHICPIIGIGASAGGLEAVNETLGSIGDPSQFAVVIVQHLDPNHVSMMAELMDRKTGFNVRQISGGEVVQPGHAYVIPPGKSLTIRDAELLLKSFDEPRGIRRPIDDFLFSLAYDQGPNSAAVILSGTGSDGADGLRAIKERGGIGVAQAPMSAKFDGMPMAAISTGLVDFILDPSAIFKRLASYFQSLKDIGDPSSPRSFLTDHIDPICGALKQATGHDFSGYKRSTVTRRIMRRMQVLEIEEATDYLERLNSDDAECEALLRDLTINVTSFYRDPAAWEVLSKAAITKIVSDNREGDTIRAWVPGCSSGEEAYTLAMLLSEEMTKQDVLHDVQIFASDIDDQMLAIAREGRYTIASLKTLPEGLRDKYIFATDGGYEITSRVRSMVQFSSHSLIKDAPFSKLDLISCRNLLIYLGDDVHNTLIPLFHYALKPNRFLFLGTSESIGRHEELFSTKDTKARLFIRRPGRATYPLNFPPNHALRRDRKASVVQSEVRKVRRDLADERILATYIPPFILVNEHGDVLRTSGKLAKFLEFPTGVPTTNIMALARPSFRDVLSPLLRSVRESNSRQVLQAVEIQSDFGVQTVDVIVDPLPDQTTLILLPQVEAFRAELRDDIVEAPEEIDRIQEMEEELRLTRFRLRSTVEELETANEELKSSNEEMMSMNEELQSSNEELSTVNEELKTKADQLSFLNADMRHFIESTDLALVILDKEMKIRTFTDAIHDIFPLKIADRGRHLGEVASLVDDTKILADAEAVLAGDTPVQRLVVRNDGMHSYSMRVLPFMTDHETIEGVTLTFTDISQLRSMEVALSDKTERLRLAIDAAGLGLWEFDPATSEANADAKIHELFGLPITGETEFDQIFAAIDPEDRDRVAQGLEIAAEGHEMYREVFDVIHPDGTRLALQGVGKLVKTADNETRIVGINFDVTAQQKALETRDILIREMNHRVKNLFSVISSMVSLATREDMGKIAMADHLKAQIRSLGIAHDVSYNMRLGTEGIALHNVLDRMLIPFTRLDGRESKLTLKGDPAFISADALTPFSLIIHEWATNAIKYGALRDQGGQLTLTWSFVPGSDDEFLVQWNEVLSTPLALPDSDTTGFGTRLIALSAQQLGGRIDTEWDTKSLTHTLIMPTTAIRHAD